MSVKHLDGRIPPAKIGGPGAAVGDTLVWDGMRWVPAAPAGGLAIIDDDEPADPPTGLFWLDTDDGVTGSPGGTITYDFADGTVPAVFVQTPTSPAATVVTDPSGDGFTEAMQLQDLGDGTTAEVKLTVEIDSGGGTLTFWRKLESETNYDLAKFQVNNITGTGGGGSYTTSGTGAGWNKQTFTLTAGIKELVWQFVKDGSTSVGFDNQRIAGIVITNTAVITATGTLKLNIGSSSSPEWATIASGVSL